MDDIIGMHEPGYDAWVGPSCNRGESEEAVAPEVEHTPETVDGHEREAHRQAQSTPDLSQHSGANVHFQRRLRRGQVETISMNFVILYH
jgi:hypothetical protein